MLDITEILNATKRNGGGTFSLTGDPVPEDGYMVGGNPLKPERVIPGWESKHGPLIHAVVRVYARGAELAGLLYLGTWVDPENGALVLDAPTHVETRETALIWAKARGEQAIYDLSTGETITV